MNDRKIKAELYRNKVNGLDFGGKTEPEARAFLKKMGYTDAEIETAMKTKKEGQAAYDKSNAKAPVDLDPYEQREFDRMTANGTSAEKALEIIVNTVEGDASQLSAGLKRLAKSKGWLNGYNNKLPSETRMDDRKARANGWKKKTAK